MKFKEDLSRLSQNFDTIRAGFANSLEDLLADLGKVPLFVQFVLPRLLFYCNR